MSSEVTGRQPRSAATATTRRSYRGPVLHAEVAGSGARVVLLHGFTQTGAAWASVADRLATMHEVVRPDLPGHGGSGDQRGDLATTARLAGDTGGRATWVGYSMGARVALRLALDRPELVDRLVLIGATAGIDSAAERAARRRSDEALAVSLEAEGVDAFLDRWLAQPLFAGLVPDPADLAARRANPAAGLAASLRDAGTGTMDPPWWDELPGLGRAGVAVHVIAGERDAKFRALGERLVAGIGPTARLAIVAEAGHAVHLQRRDRTVALLERILAD